MTTALATAQNFTLCGDRNTMPILKLNIEAHPMPGATASGRFATAPMRKHAMRLVAAVAPIRLRRTSCCWAGVVCDTPSKVMYVSHPKTSSINAET
jgi:glycine/D-amino acid oxidase-like deaminating enzyme